jgi:hypothetical protein
MATIDIALPAELTAALTPPPCIDLSLPKPSTPPPSLTLPIGGELAGLADFTRGIPTDCSMNFSLVLQLAPMMASMECLLKILQFFGDLLNACTPIPQPPAFITAFVDGLKALTTCTGMVLPTGMFCFVKDLLALIAAMLHCTVKALESVLAILSGLQIQIGIAQGAGNTDMLAALKCAQDNAATAAQGTMQSMQPITTLLQLAAPFLKIANVNLSVSIPAAVPADDLEAMQSLLQTLAEVATVLQEISDALPC